LLSGSARPGSIAFGSAAFRSSGAGRDCSAGSFREGSGASALCSLGVGWITEASRLGLGC